MWGLCWEPPIHMDAIPQQTLMHYTKNVQTYTKHIQRIYKHYRKNVQIIIKLIVYKLYVLSLIILDLYTDWKKCICPKNTIALEDIKIIWANES